MRTLLALLIAAMALTGCVVVPHDDYYAGYPESVYISVPDNGYRGNGYYSGSGLSAAERFMLPDSGSGLSAAERFMLPDRGKRLPVPAPGYSGQSGSATIVAPR